MYDVAHTGAVEALWLIALGALAYLMGQVFRQMHFPEFLGAILAGILLGPTGLGLLQSHSVEGSAIAYDPLFGAAYNTGLSVLMFAAGRSIQFTNSLKSNADTWVLVCGTLIVLVPAYLTVDLAFLAFSVNEGTSQTYQLVLTICVAVTSVPFLTKILRERQLFGSNFAKTILTAACVVDLILWLLLSVITDMHTSATYSWRTVFSGIAPELLIYSLTVTVIFLARRYSDYEVYLVNSAISDTVKGLVTLVTFLLVADAIGAEIMIASLCAGIAYANGVKAKERKSNFWHWAEKLLVPLYFATVGVSLNLLGSISLLHAAVFIFWSSSLKIGLVYSVLLIHRPNRELNKAFAVAMNTRGGPGIAMASFAFTEGMIDERTFVSVVLASLVTAVMTDSYIRRSQVSERSPAIKYER